MNYQHAYDPRSSLVYSIPNKRARLPVLNACDVFTGLGKVRREDFDDCDRGYGDPGGEAHEWEETPTEVSWDECESEPESVLDVVVEEEWEDEDWKEEEEEVFEFVSENPEKPTFAEIAAAAAAKPSPAVVAATPVSSPASGPSPSPAVDLEDVLDDLAIYADIDAAKSQKGGKRKYKAEGRTAKRGLASRYRYR